MITSLLWFAFRQCCWRRHFTGGNRHIHRCSGTPAEVRRFLWFGTGGCARGLACAPATFRTPLRGENCEVRTRLITLTLSIDLQGEPRRQMNAKAISLSFIPVIVGSFFVSVISALDNVGEYSVSKYAVRYSSSLRSCLFPYRWFFALLHGGTLAH